MVMMQQLILRPSQAAAFSAVSLSAVAGGWYLVNDAGWPITNDLIILGCATTFCGGIVPWCALDRESISKCMRGWNRFIIVILILAILGFLAALFFGGKGG